MNRVLAIIIPVSIALVLTVAFYFLNIQGLNNLIFIASSVIQILMFVYWFFGDKKQKRIEDNQEKILETAEENLSESRETKEVVQQIQKFQESKEGLLEKRQKIMANLIKNGIIPSQEMDKILKSMRQRGIFLVSTSGGNTLKLKKLIDSLGEEGPILIIPKVLKRFGFLRIYRNDSFFIILKEDLPPQLRSTGRLKQILFNELIHEWNQLKNTILGKKFKGYEKWKDGSGFHCNLCIIGVEEGEINVLYKRLKESDKYRDNFSDEFKGLLMSHTEKRKIGALIRDKVKAQQILNKISLQLIFDNLPASIKTVLVQNEAKIREELKINLFSDISNVRDVDLEKVLKTLSIDEPKKYSGIILEEIKSYLEVIVELELFKDVNT